MLFTIDATASGFKARAGRFSTAHGVVETPVFMPVGTQGVVKALDSHDVTHHLEAKIILANTYHMYLRAGIERLKKLGGIHKMANCPTAYLSDSGGFQAFSLGGSVKKLPHGIRFKSHIDGSAHMFTPKLVLDIQYALNSDIMMVLDDLIGLPAPRERILEAIQTTTRWAKESLAYHATKRAAGGAATNNLFAIIQGGVDLDMRKQSLESLLELETKVKIGGASGADSNADSTKCADSNTDSTNSADSINNMESTNATDSTNCVAKTQSADSTTPQFDGFAIGGLAVGEPQSAMLDTIDFTTDLMPRARARYLMGVGTPEDIVEAIARGVDMFDCVMPTRNARNATLFTTFGKIHIKSARWAEDENPIDARCSCYTCARYSRAYLHHLYRAGELSYHRLATLHNLHYYLELTRSARKAILSDKFGDFYREFYRLRQADS